MQPCCHRHWLCGWRQLGCAWALPSPSVTHTCDRVLHLLSGVTILHWIFMVFMLSWQTERVTLHAKFPGAAPRYAGSPFGGILVVIAGMSLHGHIGVTMVSWWRMLWSWTMSTAIMLFLHGRSIQRSKETGFCQQVAQQQGWLSASVFGR